MKIRRLRPVNQRQMRLRSRPEGRSYQKRGDIMLLGVHVGGRKLAPTYNTDQRWVLSEVASSLRPTMLGGSCRRSQARSDLQCDQKRRRSRPEAKTVATRSEDGRDRRINARCAFGIWRVDPTRRGETLCYWGVHVGGRFARSDLQCSDNAAHDATKFAILMEYKVF